MDVSYEQHRSDWSHQVSAMVTMHWLQCDQTLPLHIKAHMARPYPEEGSGPMPNMHLYLRNQHADN